MTDRNLIISPSLLSSDFGKLYQEIEDLEKSGLSWVHWDVMDGHFVPNITLGPPIIAKCRKKTDLIFDVHLMIEDPQKYLEQFIEAGSNVISVHAEIVNHLESAVSKIEKLGAKPAVALNPHTPLCQIEYLLPHLYMVLIMSVNPGFGGQSFIPFCLKKINDLKKMIEDKGVKTLIQVDGGVHLGNVGEIFANGADVLVSGSAFFNFDDYAEAYKAFQKAVYYSK